MTPSHTSNSGEGSVTDPRGEFMRYYHAGKSIREVCYIYGLGPEEAGLALHYARLSKTINAAQRLRRPIVVAPPPAPGARGFCDQCDKLVYPAEAKACGSRFCKAKAVA